MPPDVLLPDNRLEVLLEQALDSQLTKCLYHNTHHLAISLLYDYECGREQIPTTTSQVGTPKTLLLPPAHFWSSFFHLLFLQPPPPVTCTHPHTLACKHATPIHPKFRAPVCNILRNCTPCPGYCRVRLGQRMCAVHRCQKNEENSSRSSMVYELKYCTRSLPQIYAASKA